MKATGIIPARYDSSRFKGKLLEKIKGKPLLWYVYMKAKQSKLLNRVIIATDSKKIKRAMSAYDAEVVMTSSEAVTGTDRIAEVTESISSDIIVNIQGDEPLIDPALIDKLIQALIDDPGILIATAAFKVNNCTGLNDPNVVKVVMCEDDFALYFSRSIIPYPRNDDSCYYFKHLGIYAYRRGFLLTFSTLPPSDLERIESLEQLRALEYGYRIKVVESEFDSIGVDTPEDLERVRKIMENNVA